MNPMPGVRITLICRDTHTPYSGMLPGYVAGHYDYDEVHIDLSRLAEYAGARFFRDEVIGLDRTHKQVLCRTRPPVPYDFLSINIGSTPQVSTVKGAADYAVPVKPINNFNQRWLNLLNRIEHHTGKMAVVIVGGGAGGVELTLAMQFRLIEEFKKLNKDPLDLHFTLITNSTRLLPTHNAKVQQAFARILKKRGVEVHLNTRINEVLEGQVKSADNQMFEADEVLWVTQAGGADWLRSTGLTLNEDGFILVNEYLQSLNDSSIFAVGDIATMVDHPREKAGVFAVRQGKPLAINLRRMIEGKSLKPYHPQKNWLALISTGNRYAVASKGAFFYAGKLLWQWKNWIDHRFMNKFSKLTPMEPETPETSKVALTQEESSQAISAVAMRCGGCGAKVGSSVLSRALANLQPIQNDDILVGLHAPDDAAVVRIPEGMAAVHTVDFFRAFIDDPYVFGKIAANHSLGDVFAMGATAQSATAIATVPYGLESKVEDIVFQMMSGAVEVLNDAGCALVGGHTGEGKELALGFAVNGYINPDRVLSKGGMVAGQKLILTKPIGTGTLFAAHAKFSAKGRWIDAALASMMLSNKAGADCLLKMEATACTDVTGFGLLGHLVEMTKPSKVDVELHLAALPILPGAEETVAAGILSSLQPANVRLRRAILDQQHWVQHPKYPLLFDPQTAGGLLATVPADNAERCLSELKQLGYEHAAIIGDVLPEGDSLAPIRLKETK
jgi:selenide,water dikinase